MLLVAAAREELGELAGAVVGVGPVVAAVGAARFLAEQRPEAVLMIGTAGAYPGGPAIGRVVQGRRVGLSSGVAAMGLGYVPRPPEPIPCHAGLLEPLDLPSADILTSAAVTTDLTLADRLSDGWQVEHLEAYAVARACQEAGIPFAVVLGIANRVGPQAHAQWLSHRDEAQAAARAAVAPLLGAGPGEG